MRAPDLLSLLEDADGVASALAVALVGMGQAFFILELSRGAPSLPVLVGSLVAPALAAGLVAWLIRDRRPQISGTLAALAILSALAGPFGALLTLAAAAAGSVRKNGKAASQPAAESADLADTLCAALRAKRVRISGAAEARSFTDIMAEGSLHEKVDVLTLIGRRYDASFQHALRAGQRDPDASIRVLSATILARLQTKFSAAIVKLERAAEGDAPTADAWTALGQARRDFAASGLLDSRAAQLAELAAARTAFDRAAALAPEDQNLALESCRARLQSEDWRGAWKATQRSWSGPAADEARIIASEARRRMAFALHEEAAIQASS